MLLRQAGVGKIAGQLTSQGVYEEERDAMAIYLLDNSVRVLVFYEDNDCEFEDNICVRFDEECPDEEKIFKADETNIYLTATQAQELAQALLKAASTSAQACL